MKTKAEILAENPKMTNLPAKAKQWGHGAFARYCAKRQIPFETCYRAIFGKNPRRS